MKTWYFRFIKFSIKKKILKLVKDYLKTGYGNKFSKIEEFERSQ